MTPILMALFAAFSIVFGLFSRLSGDIFQYYGKRSSVACAQISAVISGACAAVVVYYLLAR